MAYGGVKGPKGKKYNPKKGPQGQSINPKAPQIKNPKGVNEKVNNELDTNKAKEQKQIEMKNQMDMAIKDIQLLEFRGF